MTEWVDRMQFDIPSDENDYDELVRFADEVASAPTLDVDSMMYDIYMKGVNMANEYHGCWVRFKDIKEIVNRYLGIE